MSFVNTFGEGIVSLAVGQPMKKTESVWCLECDHEHECEVVFDEFEDYLAVPSECEECGGPLDGGPSERREDFHSDG
jgi:hypothetical protein